MEVDQVGKTISNVSRQRAANGDARLSAETQAAIQNGALPPTIEKASSKPAPVRTENSVSQNVQAPTTESRTTVLQNEAVKVDLSAEARTILADQNNAPTTPQVTETSSIAPSIEDTSVDTAGPEEPSLPAPPTLNGTNSLFQSESTPKQDNDDGAEESFEEGQAKVETINQTLDVLSGGGLIS